MRVVLYAASVTALLAGERVGGAEPSEAGRNPFGRPSLSVASSRAQSVRIAKPAFALRATMASGAESLVNIEGQILRLGEEFGGYRLIAVGEGTAIFVKDGVEHSVGMQQ